MSSSTQGSPAQLENDASLLLIEHWWYQSFPIVSSTLSFSDLESLNIKPTERASERE